MPVPSVATDFVKNFTHPDSPLFPQYLTACLEEAAKRQLRQEAIELYLFLQNLEEKDRATAEQALTNVVVVDSVVVKPVKHEVQEGRNKLVDELMKKLVAHIAALHDLEEKLDAHDEATKAAFADFVDTKSKFAEDAGKALAIAFGMSPDSEEIKEFEAGIEATKSESDLLRILGPDHPVHETKESVKRAYISAQPRAKGRTSEETEELELKLNVEAEQYARQQVLDPRAEAIMDVKLLNVVIGEIKEQNAATREYHREQRHLTDVVRDMLRAQYRLQEQMANVNDGTPEANKLANRHAEFEQKIALGVKRLKELQSRPVPAAASSYEASLRSASKAAKVPEYLAKLRSKNNKLTRLDIGRHALNSRFVAVVMEARDVSLQLNSVAQGAVPRDLLASLERAIQRAAPMRDNAPEILEQNRNTTPRARR